MKICFGGQDGEPPDYLQQFFARVSRGPLVNLSTFQRIIALLLIRVSVKPLTSRMIIGASESVFPRCQKHLNARKEEQVSNHNITQWLTDAAEDALGKDHPLPPRQIQEAATIVLFQLSRAFERALSSTITNFEHVQIALFQTDFQVV